MNKKQTILGIITIVILAILGWLFVNAIITWLKSLDVTVVASLTTAILGLMGLWYAQWHSKSRDIAESHRASKIEVYNILFDLLDNLQAERTEGKKLPDSFKNDFKKLNRGLILWASPKVITSWLNFRKTSTSGGNALLAMNEVYKAIRKDLDNSNFGLKSGDLIRIGLKDPNELQ